MNMHAPAGRAAACSISTMRALAARPGASSTGASGRLRSPVPSRAANESAPTSVDPPPIVHLDELDGSSSDTFYGSLAERGDEVTNVVICYTSKCLPCKMAKPLMKEWEEDLLSQGKLVRFWQFALTLPHKDVALSLGVNTSPQFLVIRGGKVLLHTRGKASVDEVREFVYETARGQ
jgi:thiol-disulfide isomerase/thioredoxin